MIAARNGGDPDANPRLRTAITAAKAVSMPNDNIKRAIMRGTGELEGGMIEEFTYEGYGPGGVAVIVEVATDNKNRTVSEIRHAFSKNGGNMGEQGSVAWMFERKGQIILEGENLNEDELMNLVLEAGADDLRAGRRHMGSHHRPGIARQPCRKPWKRPRFPMAQAKLAMVPKNLIQVEGKQRQGLAEAAGRARRARRRAERLLERRYRREGDGGSRVSGTPLTQRARPRHRLWNRAHRIWRH